MRIDPEDEVRVRRLRRLRPGRRILSVYLETDPGLALHHGHLPKLMDILSDLRHSTSEVEEYSLSQESERVLSFVRDEYVPHGRTLIIFSSRPRRLWEVMSVQLPMRPLARFAARPYLIPLEVALEDHPHVAVALVGEEKIRLFTTVMDEIETEHHMKDDVPGRQRQGGWAAFKYQRDRERHIHEHFGHVVEELRELQAKLPYKWLVLGGADDATSAVVAQLPRGLKEKLAGTFREELFENETVVAEHAAAVARLAERNEELQLAEKIRDRAFAGGLGTLGWKATIQALEEGRTHRLAIAATKLGSDEADNAFALASDTGAIVEVVHGEGERVLASSDGIGALLRF
jgi:peptide subunit release factor 1 (eRF1)